MSKVIKQSDKLSCVACVACMATDTSLKEFREFMGDVKPPYNDLAFYAYLLKHGFVVGIGFQNKFFESKFLSVTDEIQINFKLRDFPAYVVVQSHRFKGLQHVVYWDGEKVLDSNPDIKGDGFPLEQYRVLTWFPIIKLSEAGELPKYGDLFKNWRVNEA